MEASTLQAFNAFNHLLFPDLVFGPCSTIAVLKPFIDFLKTTYFESLNPYSNHFIFTKKTTNSKWKLQDFKISMILIICFQTWFLNRAQSLRF